MDANANIAWTPGYLVSGRFRLESLLGQGGFAQVWKATDISLSRPVAIKVLHPTVDPLDQDRFVKEAKLLARLNAPSIVAVHDAGVDSARAYLIMEFVHGTTLSSLIQNALPPLGLGIDLAIQIARGVHYLHQNSIIHRDIKPGNILIYRTETSSSTGSAWTVKVTDFGLARIIEGDLRSQSVTGAGLLAGTLPYMAPELITDAKIGPSIDIYALGVTFFEMFTGSLPFPEIAIASIIRRRDQEPPDPLSRSPELPTDLASFVRRMLSPKPGDRPGSAAEVAAFFQSISSAHPPSKWTPPEEQIREARTKTPVSFLEAASAPAGFFTEAPFQKSLFFENESVRFKIKPHEIEAQYPDL